MSTGEVQVERVVKRYGDFEAVRGVDLTIRGSDPHAPRPQRLRKNNASAHDRRL